MYLCINIHFFLWSKGTSMHYECTNTPLFKNVYNRFQNDNKLEYIFFIMLYNVPIFKYTFYIYIYSDKHMTVYM